MKKLFAIFLVLVLALGTAGSVRAALWDRGSGLIFDDVLNITWLQYANLAGAMMTWTDAVVWADQLDYGGFDDWRLPSALNMDGSGPDYFINVTGSEMGNLFYTTLGNTAQMPISNVGPFENIQIGCYWYQEEDADNSLRAWYFNFSNGNQNRDPKSLSFYAWAVRDGDVTVPIPGAVWLLGSGLLGLVGWRRTLKS